MSAFGSGPSNGQFWYGSQTNFPGFLYKKNVGVGGRRSTKMAPGGNITCNSATDLYNKYKPGTGGVGASSTANRRAKNRLATICGSSNKCFPCYNTLGQYSNYTHNPNGFIPCPSIIQLPPLTYSATGTYTVSSNSQYNNIITFTGNGTFQISRSYPVSYIVVGGGAGGGSGFGSGGAGGGGGGGVITNSALFDSLYTITIGSGGTGGSISISGDPGTNGGDSSIIGSTSYIANGGYGGGGTGGASGTPGSTAGTIGGGGNAGFSGSPGSLNITTIYGTTFGAGGGGGTVCNGASAGGAGGNSNAGNGAGGAGPTAPLAQSGVVNTGGGGGGGSANSGACGSIRNAGGNGGSGIVILYFNV